VYFKLDYTFLFVSILHFIRTGFSFVELTDIGADFSNFQGVFRFALQILPADNLKGFKTHPKTKSRHQKHKERTEWNYRVFTRLCSSWIPRISLVKTELTIHNSTSSTTYQKCGGGKTINYKHSTTEISMPKWVPTYVCQKNNYGENI
jgi:hypothetical protein